MKMNLPNKLTILRIVMVPFFVFFLLADFVPHRYLFCPPPVLRRLLHRPPRRQNRPPWDNLITNFGKLHGPPGRLKSW